MNIENLKRIHHYLGYVAEAGTNFSMLYMNDGRKRCIIGSAELITPYDDLKNFESSSGVFNYEKFGEWFFGIQEGSREWDYLFNSGWSNDKTTNTPQHAQYRITMILGDYEPEDIASEILSEQQNPYQYEN